MFRDISIVSFVIVIGAVFLHSLILPVTGKRLYKPIEFIKRLVHLFTLFFIEQKPGIFAAIRKLIYLLSFLSFVVLFITGFYQLIITGEKISGYFLMIHVTFGGVLAACLAVLALMWAENYRFDKNYLPFLNRMLHRQPQSELPTEKSELLRKVLFWLIIVLALPLILSVILSMFPVFGTNWQRLLEEIHRYTALALALIIIIHTYFLTRIKIKKDSQEN